MNLSKLYRLSTFFSFFFPLYFLLAIPVYSIEQPQTEPVATDSSSDTTTEKLAQPAQTGNVYVLDWNFRPGDGVRVNLMPDTGFPNEIFVVDAQGYVDIPMIGPVQVTTVGREEFQKMVYDAYIPLLRYSSVMVRRVISLSFQGGFRRPGVYWVSPGATLWYAMSMTGGVIRQDGLKRIKWEKKGQLMELRGIKLLENPAPIEEMGFQTGDVIRVITRQDRTGWEVFRQEILPLVTFGISTALSAYTLYKVLD
ncbi:MAG: hypothetical protein Q4F84_00055 [Fibrobacter sp.]|nr:hypothetical protein [Fibrobacter sp.]